MKNEFSTAWKASSNPAKQRKYAHNAPLHIKRHFMASPLSKELKQKHGTRNIPVRKGDKVKIARGQFKGHVGKVERADVSRCRVFVTGAEVQKRDGSRSLYPIHPSNVMIVELESADKMRTTMIERKKNKGAKTK